MRRATAERLTVADARGRLFLWIAIVGIAWPLFVFGSQGGALLFMPVIVPLVGRALGALWMRSFGDTHLSITLGIAALLIGFGALTWLMFVLA